MDEHDEQAKGAGSVNQDVAGLGLQHPRKGTADRQQSTPDAASGAPIHTPPSSSNRPNATTPEQTADNEPVDGPHAAPQALPFPSSGVARPCTAWFRAHTENLPPPLVSWCRRQLIQHDFRTLEDCEPLAEAFIIFYKGTLPDHDWANEADVPYLPFTPKDLSRGYDGQILWGNLRRLHAMTQGAPALREYLDRNVTKDGLYIENADRIAYEIIKLVQAKGLSHDWDTQADIVINHPSVETTKKYPLQDLAGHWNVSILILLW